MEGIYLLLGSNIGDRKSSLINAVDAIRKQIGPIIQASSIHVSSAWGLEDQPDFLNQVVRVHTNIDPFQLLKTIQKIEIELGRVRYEKWGPRIIDIDILYYNDQIIQSAELTVPHPAIPARRFTLEPLVELAPEFVHPVLQKSNTDLLSMSTDTLEVQTILEA